MLWCFDVIHVGDVKQEAVERSLLKQDGVVRRSRTEISVQIEPTQGDVSTVVSPQQDVARFLHEQSGAETGDETVFTCELSSVSGAVTAEAAG